MPKETLNCASVTIKFSKKELAKMADGDISNLVVKTYGRLFKKYPKLIWTGKWNLTERSLIFHFNKVEVA